LRIDPYTLKLVAARITVEMIWIPPPLCGVRDFRKKLKLANCYLLIAANKKARLQPGFLIS